MRLKLCLCVLLCHTHTQKHTYKWMYYRHNRRQTLLAFYHHSLLHSGYTAWLCFPASSLLPLHLGIPQFGYKFQPTEHKKKWLFFLLTFCCCITNHRELSSLKTIAICQLIVLQVESLGHLHCVLRWGFHEVKIKATARPGSYLQTLGKNSLPFWLLAGSSALKLWVWCPCFLAGYHLKTALYS